MYNFQLHKVLRKVTQKLQIFNHVGETQKLQILNHVSEIAEKIYVQSLVTLFFSIKLQSPFW